MSNITKEDAGSIRSNPWDGLEHPEIKEEIYKSLDLIIKYGTDEFAEIAEFILKKLHDFDKQAEKLKKL